MRQILLSAIFFLAIMGSALAQYPRGGGNYGGGYGGFGKRPSGTYCNESQKDFIKLHKIAIHEFDDTTSRGLIEVPVKIHIVAKSDGSKAVPIPEVKTAIRHLNSYFLKAYIRFVPLQDYNYIRNDDLYKLKLENEDELCKKYDVRNVINLYINYKIQGERNSFCGYTHMPDKNNVDRVFITKKCLNNGASLVRQMGHYFSLYPTSGPDLTMRSEEMADGSNCLTTGDEICDTPADPGLNSQNVDERCEFVGTVQDGNSKFYRPMTTNIMSDNPNYACRTELTKEQYRRIMYAAAYIRNYLEFPLPPDMNKKFLKSLKKQHGVDLSVELNVDGRKPKLLLNRNLYKVRGEYRAGSSYKMEITVNQKGYLYVFEGDDQRGLNLIYPLEGDKQFFEGGKKSVSLPSKGRSLKIDQNNSSKSNYICVLFSRKQLPIKEFSKMVNALSESKLTLFQRFFAVHEERIVASKDMEFKNAQIEMSALTVDRPLVPLFIEITQN